MSAAASSGSSSDDDGREDLVEDWSPPSSDSEGEESLDSDDYAAGSNSIALDSDDSDEDSDDDSDDEDSDDDDDDDDDSSRRKRKKGGRRRRGAAVVRSPTAFEYAARLIITGGIALAALYVILTKAYDVSFMHSRDRKTWPLEFQFWPSEDEQFEALDKWPAAAVTAQVWLLLGGMANAFPLSMFLCDVLHHTLPLSLPKRHILESLPFLAVFVDVVEKTAWIVVLITYSDRAPIAGHIARAFNVAKWGLYTFNFTLAILGVIFLPFRWMCCSGRSSGGGAGVDVADASGPESKKRR